MRGRQPPLEKLGEEHHKAKLGFVRKAAVGSKQRLVQAQVIVKPELTVFQIRDLCTEGYQCSKDNFHSPISTEVMLTSKRCLALASSFSRGGWRRLAACCCQDTEHGQGSINGSQPSRTQEIRHLLSRYQEFTGEHHSQMLSKDILWITAFYFQLDFTQKAPSLAAGYPTDVYAVSRT